VLASTAVLIRSKLISVCTVDLMVGDFSEDEKRAAVEHNYVRDGQQNCKRPASFFASFAPPKL